MTVLKKDGTTIDAPSAPRASNPPGKKAEKKNKKVERRTGPVPVTYTYNVTKTKKVT